MKIGSYSIPNIRLFPKIVEYANTLYETYEFTEAPDENAVAVALGHKTANSGAFLSKLADLRLYGLLESHALRVTSLTERITHGSEEQKQEATNEAVFNVALWKEIYGKFGVTLQESNFWAQLQSITGVSHLEAQKHADFVRKAYLDDISHIKLEKEEKNMEDQKSSDIIDTNQAKPPEGLEQLTLGSNIKIWLPKGDKESAKKAIQLIKLYSGITEED